LMGDWTSPWQKMKKANKGGLSDLDEKIGKRKLEIGDRSIS